MKTKVYTSKYSLRQNELQYELFWYCRSSTLTQKFVLDSMSALVNCNHECYICIQTLKTEEITKLTWFFHLVQSLFGDTL